MSEEEYYPHEHPLPENVVAHPMRAQMDLPVEDILRGAHKADLAVIAVVGIRNDGRNYLSCSCADTAEAMFLLQRGLHKLNQICDELDADTQPGNPPEKGSA